MKKKLINLITIFAGIIEVFISMVILVAILAASVSLVKELGIFGGDLVTTKSFDSILSNALTLVIGVEFIKMLIKHTPSSAIEVLLYAIARQLIVSHSSASETLLGILSVAGVFAIRKYLFIKSFDED